MLLSPCISTRQVHQSSRDQACSAPGVHPRGARCDARLKILAPQRYLQIEGENFFPLTHKGNQRDLSPPAYIFLPGTSLLVYPAPLESFFLLYLLLTLDPCPLLKKTVIFFSESNLPAEHANFE